MKKTKQQRAIDVCTRTVQIAKYLAKRGHAIDKITIARSCRSCYIKLTTAKKEITIRISDHMPAPFEHTARKYFYIFTHRHDATAIPALLSYIDSHG